MYYGYTPFPFLHIIGVIIIIILVVWIIRLLVHGPRMHNPRWNGRFNNQKDSAMDILRERYAKGEITKAEFDERKKDLM